MYHLNGQLAAAAPCSYLAGGEYACAPRAHHAAVEGFATASGSIVAAGAIATLDLEKAGSRNVGAAPGSTQAMGLAGLGLLRSVSVARGALLKVCLNVRGSTDSTSLVAGPPRRLRAAEWSVRGDGGMCLYFRATQDGTIYVPQRLREYFARLAAEVGKCELNNADLELRITSVSKEATAGFRVNALNGARYGELTRSLQALARSLDLQSLPPPGGAGCQFGQVLGAWLRAGAANPAAAIDSAAAPSYPAPPPPPADDASGISKRQR
jgi:hypothetical protein